MIKKGKGPHPVHKTYVAIGGSLVALILFAAIFVYLVPTQFVGKAGETGPQCASVPSGLVGWYKAEGNAADSSGNENDGHLGTDAAADAADPSFAEGKVGRNSFHFTSIEADGVGMIDFVEVSPPASSAFDFGNNPFTIEGWIKTESSTAPQGIVSFFNIIAEYKGYVVGLNMDPAACWGGKICFLPKNNALAAAPVWQGVTSDIVNNEWTHIAVVHSGANVIFYVNGENKGSIPVESLAPLSPAGMDFVIGKKGSAVPPALAASYPFQGMIDELSLYTRDLTEEEIISIYEADSFGKCVTETGNSCYDDIDNDNDGDVDCDDADCRAPRSVTLNGSREYAATLRSDDCPGAGLAVRII